MIFSYFSVFHKISKKSSFFHVFSLFLTLKKRVFSVCLFSGFGQICILTLFLCQNQMNLLPYSPYPGSENRFQTPFGPFCHFSCFFAYFRKHVFSCQKNEFSCFLVSFFSVFLFRHEIWYLSCLATFYVAESFF